MSSPTKLNRAIGSTLAIIFGGLLVALGLTDVAFGQTPVEVVVDFDDPLAPAALTGVWEGIDWGTGQWATWGGFVGGCPPRQAWMTCSPEGCRSAKCREFTFVEPSVLRSFSAGTYVEPGDLEVRSFDANGNLLESLGPVLVADDQCGAYNTGWTQTASTVEMCFEFGSDLVVDDVTYTTAQTTTTTTTLPGVCGDSAVNQPGEDCDGSDDTVCPGLCRLDCTCPPFQFFDDFDRADADDLGNGWEAQPGNPVDHWTLTNNAAVMTFTNGSFESRNARVRPLAEAVQNVRAVVSFNTSDPANFPQIWLRFQDVTTNSLDGYMFYVSNDTGSFSPGSGVMRLRNLDRAWARADTTWVPAADTNYLMIATVLNGPGSDVDCTFRILDLDAGGSEVFNQTWTDDGTEGCGGLAPCSIRGPGRSGLSGYGGCIGCTIRYDDFTILDLDAGAPTTTTFTTTTVPPTSTSTQPPATTTTIMATTTTTTVTTSTTTTPTTSTTLPPRPVVVVDFDNPQAPQSLTGVWEGIDWGQGDWFTWGSSVGGCPPRQAWMSCAPEGCRSPKCRDFGFVEPSILQSFSAGTVIEPGDITLRSFDASDTLLEQFGPDLVTTDRCIVYETGWTLGASRVEVCFEFGSDLAFDDVTYLTTGAPPPVSTTSTQPPATTTTILATTSTTTTTSTTSTLPPPVEVVVDFDDPQAPVSLTGVWEGIDWGQGNWFTWGGFVGGCPPQQAWMSCSPEGCRSAKCRDFTFVAPSILRSFRAGSPIDPGDVSLRSFDAAGGLLEQFGPALVTTNQCLSYQTGWTEQASRVEVCFEFGSDLALDDVTYIQAGQVCGDNIASQPGEDCDGTDDIACPGLCRPNCTCPPALFFDDFNRPNANDLGNGWQAQPGNPVDHWTLDNNAALMTFTSQSFETSNARVRPPAEAVRNVRAVVRFNTSNPADFPQLWLRLQDVSTTSLDGYIFYVSNNTVPTSPGNGVIRVRNLNRVWTRVDTTWAPSPGTDYLMVATLTNGPGNNVDCTLQILDLDAGGGEVLNRTWTDDGTEGCGGAPPCSIRSPGRSGLSGFGGCIGCTIRYDDFTIFDLDLVP